MCMTGMAAANNPIRSMTTCPDRRSGTASVPYRKAARISSAVFELSALYSTNDVVRNVKRQEEEREQGCNRQNGVVFHWKNLLMGFYACLIPLLPLPTPSMSTANRLRD